MSIESDIKTQLDGYAGLSALVGSRNHREQARKVQTYPFTVYERVQTSFINSLSGTNAMKNPRFQIDCFANSADAATAVGDQVINAMTLATTFSAIPQNAEINTFDESSGVHRYTVDFSVWSIN